MKTYRIHLIRHGLTQGNIDGTYVGHRDLPVCESGLEQLKQMKNDYVYPDVPVVFCSPLLRCRQTAEVIYPDKEPVIINELIEYNFGEFEGKSADELKKDEVFTEWLAGGPDAAPPFGESNGEFGKRVGSAIEKIIEGMLKSGTTETSIVTHGGVIMGIMSMYALPEQPMTDWLVPNGCGYTIIITPSLWTHARKFEAVAEIPYVVNEDYDANFGGRSEDAFDMDEFEKLVNEQFNPESIDLGSYEED